MNRSVTGKRGNAKRSQSTTPTSSSSDPSSSSTSLNTSDNKTKTKDQTKNEKAGKTSLQPTLALFTKRFSMNSTVTTEDNDSDNEVDPTQQQSEELQCSNTDILKYLATMNDSIQKKLDVVNNTVEQLKSEIFDLNQQNDKLKEELKDCRNKQEELYQHLEETKHATKLSLDRSNRNEQYSRRNNIKILFVEEEEKKFESMEESEQKVLKILNEQLNLKYIKSEHIEIAHRVGDKRKIKNRPLIVKFISRKTKLEVMKNKKLLKNSSPKLVITEDLTKVNYQLFKTVQDHEGTIQAWTIDGKIFAKDNNDKIYRIEALSDLQKLNTSTSRSSQRSRRQTTM